MTVTAPGNEPTQTLSDLVAEEVRALLARRRISGRELARKMGKSHSWIGFRLSGTQTIDLNDLDLIAEALGVRVYDLLPREVEGRTVVTSGQVDRSPTLRKTKQTIRTGRTGRPPRATPATSTRRPAQLAAAVLA